MSKQARGKRGVGLALLAGALSMALAGPALAAPEGSPVRDGARDAFWRGDFAALEKQYASLRQGGNYTIDGKLELDLFREGLAAVFDHNARPNEPYVREVDELTLQWATEHPQSALAQTLHARALLRHAWSYRGNGYAGDVTPEAMREFERYLRSAMEYLKDHADVALSDSYAHLTLLDIGKAYGLSQKQMEAIAENGLKQNPRDAILYFSVAGRLLPKWGGDANTLDRYIRHATAQTQAQYGSGLYAWLYSTVAREQYGHALFDGSLADWPTMKQGFDDLMARFPDSVMHRNRYAYFACRARDKPVLQAQLGLLAGKLDVKEWGDNGERSLEGCQRWVSES